MKHALLSAASRLGLPIHPRTRTRQPANCGTQALPSLGLPNSISFTLVKGGTTAAEVNDSCTNTLTLTKATATVLTFSEPGTDQCVAGTVTFTLQDGKLAYRWTGGGEQNTGTLSKK